MDSTVSFFNLENQKLKYLLQNKHDNCSCCGCNRLVAAQIFVFTYYRQVMSRIVRRVDKYRIERKVISLNCELYLISFCRDVNFL